MPIPSLRKQARIAHQLPRPRATVRRHSAFASVEKTASIPSLTETPANTIACAILARFGERCGLAWGVVGALGVPAAPGCLDQPKDRVEIASATDACIVCHEDEWRTTRLPDHGLAAFGASCELCHDRVRWAPAPGFVHTDAFVLEAGHAGPRCGHCHAQGPVSAAPVRPCGACHAEAAAAVVDPIHTGFSRDCLACHGTDGFLPARFEHVWPLEGRHGELDCRACHGGDPPVEYAGTTTRCVNCHAAQRALADERVAGHTGFPQACDQCHGFDAFGSE